MVFMQRFLLHKAWRKNINLNRVAYLNPTIIQLSVVCLLLSEAAFIAGCYLVLECSIFKYSFWGKSFCLGRSGRMFQSVKLVRADCGTSISAWIFFPFKLDQFKTNQFSIIINFVICELEVFQTFKIFENNLHMIA